MNASPFRPLLASSVLLLTAGAYAGPLQFELGPPKDVEPGEIRKPSAEVTELWQGERKIFSAKSIVGRSVSSGDPAKATWIVSAITANSADGKETQSEEIPHELWFITPDGSSRRLGAPPLDATRPLISPDGATVAFTGSYGSEDSQSLFLCDTSSGEVIATSLHYFYSRGRSRTGARTWSADSRTLTFYVGRDSDDSEEALRTLTLPPAARPAHPLKFEFGPDLELDPGADRKVPDGASLSFKLGEIRNPSPNVDELWIGDRKIFSAHRIGARSYSGNDPATATWVVEAVTGDRWPMNNEGSSYTLHDGKWIVDASPREIYLITPDGKSRRISLPRTDASEPVISPDGATVAFVSSPVFEDGATTQKKLYLYDAANGEITYAAAHPLEDLEHFIGVDWWSSDSRSLFFSDQKYESNSPSNSFRTLKLLPKE